MHGNATSLQDMVYYMNQTAFNMKADVVCFAFRGYTQSDGTPSDPGLTRDG